MRGISLLLIGTALLTACGTPPEASSRASTASPASGSTTDVCESGATVREIKRKIDELFQRLSSSSSRDDFAADLDAHLKDLNLAWDELKVAVPSHLALSVEEAKRIDMRIHKARRDARTWEEFLKNFDPEQGGLGFDDLGPVVALDRHFQRACGLMIFN